MFGYAFLGSSASATAKAVADAGRPAWGAGRIDAAKADAALHLLEGAAAEGVPARHHFVEDHPQRPDIVGFPGRAAGEDLGREVGQGATHHGRVVHRVRQPEIQQLRRPLRGESDVAGLDVPVQASLLMQGRQGAGQPGWSRG